MANIVSNTVPEDAALTLSGVYIFFDVNYYNITKTTLLNVKAYLWNQYKVYSV